MNEEVSSFRRDGATSTRKRNSTTIGTHFTGTDRYCIGATLDNSWIERSRLWVEGQYVRAAGEGMFGIGSFVDSVRKGDDRFQGRIPFTVLDGK